MPALTFYFDLGSPYAYVAAERLDAVVAEPVAWQPVLLGGLLKLTGRSSWALGDYPRRQRGMAEIEQRALGYGLPPLRWPDPWPSNCLFAARTTAVAFAGGQDQRRAFTQSAFRAAFQRGRGLSIAAHVLDAARAAGLSVAGGG
jgi:2-hydroxychromene-2-carboxylate isomerase